MNKPTHTLWMLGTLALALSAAPLFAQQNDANSPSSNPPAAQSQSPSSQSPSQDQSAQPGQSQSPSGQAQPSQPPAGQSGADAQGQSSDSQSFSGTVAKSGDKYVLQDASGKTYDVDRQEELKKYEGKQVRIKGTLDPDGKTIHVK
jgi:hypothetical protein